VGVCGRGEACSNFLSSSLSLSPSSPCSEVLQGLSVAHVFIDCATEAQTVSQITRSIARQIEAASHAWRKKQQQQQQQKRTSHVLKKRSSNNNHNNHNNHNPAVPPFSDLLDVDSVTTGSALCTFLVSTVPREMPFYIVLDGAERLEVLRSTNSRGRLVGASSSDLTNLLHTLTRLSHITGLNVGVLLLSREPMILGSTVSEAPGYETLFFNAYSSEELIQVLVRREELALLGGGMLSRPSPGPRRNQDAASQDASASSSTLADDGQIRLGWYKKIVSAFMASAVRSSRDVLVLESQVFSRLVKFMETRLDELLGRPAPDTTTTVTTTSGTSTAIVTRNHRSSSSSNNSSTKGLPGSTSEWEALRQECAKVLKHLMDTPWVESGGNNCGRRKRVEVSEKKKDAEPVLDLSMGYTSKLVLLSAYIASRNAEKTDSQVFEFRTDRSVKRRKVTKQTHDRAVEAAREAEFRPRHCFTLERLMRVFQGLLRAEWDDDDDDDDDGEEEEGKEEEDNRRTRNRNRGRGSFPKSKILAVGRAPVMSSDVQQQLATLIAHRYVVPQLGPSASVDPLDTDTKYRCEVTDELAQKLAENLSIKINEYLRLVAA